MIRLRGALDPLPDRIFYDPAGCGGRVDSHRLPLSSGALTGPLRAGMLARMHEHEVRIYYEDTDHSGLVYHANYLKYFERAREHMLGTDELRRLFVEEGVGFVVYKAELTYKQGAVFGDVLTVRSRVEAPSPYRAVFHQDALRAGELLVRGVLTLVCVDRDKKLVELPPSVRAKIRGS